MALRLIIKNTSVKSGSASKVITLNPGQHYTLQSGDIARALDRADIKIFRRKQSLVIRPSEGEEYVLDNFYDGTSKSDTRQIFSWDDTGGESKATASAAMQPSATSESVAVAPGATSTTDMASTNASGGDTSSSSSSMADSGSSTSSASTSSASTGAAAGMMGSFFGGNPVAPIALAGGLVAGIGIAASGGGGGGGVASTLISGIFQGGPVIAGLASTAQALTVVAYDKAGKLIVGADGNAISAKVDATGRYSLDLGSYTGAVTLVLQDKNGAAPDYYDEAGGTKSAGSNFSAVAVAGGGAQTVNINALTTIAATAIGNTLNDTTVSNVNAKVAQYFLNMPGADVTALNPNATINVDASNVRSANPNANTVGQVLALLSAAEQLPSDYLTSAETALKAALAAPTDATKVADLVNKLQTLYVQAGARASGLGASVSGMTISNVDTVLSTVFPDVKLLIVGNTDVIPKNGGVLGTATVHFRFAQAPDAGTFTVADLVASNGALSNLTKDATDATLYTATFTPTAGTVATTATITLASGAAITVGGLTYTQGAALNPLTSNNLGFTLSLGTPAPALALDYDSGFSASDGVTNNGQVNVTGLVGGSWEYQIDGGAWVAGTGKSFALTTGVHSYNVRQVYLTETATASTAVTYNYDIVGPATPSLALASDTGTSASDNITNNPTINVVGLEAAAGTRWFYQVDGGSWATGTGASFTASSGKHTYEVIQTDAAGNPSPASLTPKVITLDTALPTVTTTTFNFAENGTAVAAALTANATVTDASEPATVTWAIASGADGSFFNIDASTGAVTFKSAPNYEMPRGLAFNAASNNDAYTVNVTATDVAGNVKAQAIVVNVTDVNERPTLGTNTTNQTAVLAQNFRLDVSTAFGDPDNETNSATALAGKWGTLTYSATGLSAIAGLNISSAGVISGAPSATTANPVSITVTATDGGGLSITETFTLSVVSAPVVQTFSVTDTTATNGAQLGKSGEPLVFVANMSEAVTVVTTGGTPSITFSVNGVAVTANYASGSGTNMLTFTGGTVPATGSGTAISITSIALNGGTVTGNLSARDLIVASVGQTYAGYTVDNTVPTVNTTTFNVAENTTAVGTLAASETVTWSLGTGADTSRFGLTGGVLSFSTAPNFEMPRSAPFSAATNNNIYTVNVNATDAAGNVRAQAIVVNVTDVNEAPAVGTNTANQTGVLNQAFTLNVSGAFSDPDNETNSAAALAGKWGTLTYTATGLPTGLVINAATGAITGTITGIPAAIAPAAPPSDSISNTAFGGVVATVVNSGVPASAIGGVGASGSALRVEQAVGNEGWAGVTFAILATGAEFINTANKVVTVKVYAPAAGLDVKLKFEDAADRTHTIEKDVLTTSAGWQVLTFDFSTVTTGTAAFNDDWNYNKGSIFLDFLVTAKTAARTFYVDDIAYQRVTAAGPAVASTITFEPVVTLTDTISSTAFGGVVATVVNSGVPASVIGGVGASGSALKIEQAVGNEGSAGVTFATLATGAEFINTANKVVTVKVYAPAAGLDVKLKLEDSADNTHTIEKDVLTTSAGWQVLTFDFSTVTPGSAPFNDAWNYNKGSIFLDFLVTAKTAARTFYVDDIAYKRVTAAGAAVDSTITFDEAGAGAGGGGANGAGGTTGSTVVTVVATDGGGLKASETFTINVVSAPVVQSFTVSDTTTTNGAQLGKSGEPLVFVATMSEAVAVVTTGGTPSITFSVNGQTVTANYASGSGTNMLTFTGGTVPATGNGTAISITSIALNGGTVTGNLSTQAWVTASVGQTYAGYTVDNTAPTVNTTTFNAAENTTAVGTLAANETVTWSLGTAGAGTDTSLFNLTDNVLTFKAAPNFEMPRNAALSAANSNAYTVNVNATDTAGNVKAQAIVVNVTDVNERPVLGTNTPNQTAVTGQSFTINTATAFSDPDSVNTYAVGSQQWGTLTYSATGLSAIAGLSINASTGVISGTASATTASAASITVTATDGGGLNITETFTLSVVSAPVVQSFTVSDTTLTNGAQVGKSGEPLVFVATMSEAVTVVTSGGTPSIVFSVNGVAVTATYASGSGTNMLTFTGGTVPATGNGTAISITSIALNGGTVTGNLSTQAWVTTSLGQPYAGYTVDNTAPTVNTTTFNAAENTTAVGTLAANETVTWSLGAAGAGTDTSRFTLTGNVLTFTTAPNFEMPRNAAFNAATNNNMYTVNVNATDTAGNVTAQAVVVSVTDVNEAPTLTSPTRGATSVLLNQAANLNVSGDFTDPDTLASNAAWRTLTYVASGLPSGLSINANTGVIGGTATATTASAASVTVTATDGGGSSVTETFSLSVVNTPALAAVQTLDNVGTTATSKPLDVRSALVIAFNQVVTFNDTGTQTIKIMDDMGTAGLTRRNFATSSPTETVVDTFDNDVVITLVSGVVTKVTVGYTTVGAVTTAADYSSRFDLANSVRLVTVAGVSNLVIDLKQKYATYDATSVNSVLWAPIGVGGAEVQVTLYGASNSDGQAGSPNASVAPIAVVKGSTPPVGKTVLLDNPVDSQIAAALASVGGTSAGAHRGSAPFDWDFGANYHVELDAGLVKNSGGLTSAAVTDATVLNFKTVTPYSPTALNVNNLITNATASNATGIPAQSVIMDATGANNTLTDSFVWLNGNIGQATALPIAINLAGGKFAVVQDVNKGPGTDGDSYRSSGMQTYIQLQNFGVENSGTEAAPLWRNMPNNDILYLDNHGDQAYESTDGRPAAQSWSPDGGTGLKGRYLTDTGSTGGTAKIVFDYGYDADNNPTFGDDGASPVHQNTNSTFRLANQDGTSYLTTFNVLTSDGKFEYALGYNAIIGG